MVHGPEQCGSDDEEPEMYLFDDVEGCIVLVRKAEVAPVEAFAEADALEAVAADKGEDVEEAKENAEANLWFSVGSKEVISLATSLNHVEKAKHEKPSL